jgi:hypothetical protein
LGIAVYHEPLNRAGNIPIASPVSIIAGLLNYRNSGRLWRSLVLNANGKMARCLIYQNVAEYADLNGSSVREL